MAEPGLTGPSEARVMIDNVYLEANKDVTDASADINLHLLTPPQAFLRIKAARKLPRGGNNGTYSSRGISINFVGDGQGGLDTDATLGLVNGKENNDPYFLPERFAVGVMHPNRFKKIRPNGTTARGIIIHQ